MFGARNSYLFFMVLPLVARGKMGWTMLKVVKSELKSLKLEASPKGLIRS